ncbi:MAG: hypothetical protein HYR85_05860 [Planctomycetes bacterium]|nr:hypothetical protein [Planctomycetota bacterium]
MNTFVSAVLIATAFLWVASPSGALPDDAKPEIKVIQESGPPEKSVDVLFVGDGYTKAQLHTKYLKDIERYTKRLFEEAPFKFYVKKFNVRALLLESKDEGCNKSPTDTKVKTALGSHFDRPDGRFLTFGDEKKLMALVQQAGPTDIVFVMVNSEKYGGGGTFLNDLPVRGKPTPAPTFAAQDTHSFEIAIHELGHSFALLGDEYVDEKEGERHPLPEGNADFYQPNVTLAGHFDATSFATLKKTVKWGHFLELPGAEKSKWLYEGAFFRAKGVFRPWKTCKLVANEQPFCPVCEEEVTKAILACCGETWDDAAYHKARPLSSWK